MTDTDAFAFPRIEADTGLFRRDYFAAQALTGLLANRFPYIAGEIAQEAYRIADDMIAESGRVGE